MALTHSTNKLFILAVSLFAISCLANFGAPQFIVNLEPYWWQGRIGFFAGGLLVGEFALLGLLMTYWRVHLIQRFFTTAVAMIVLTACWIIALTDFGEDPIPVNIYVICMTLGVVGVALEWLILSILRWWYLRQRRRSNDDLRSIATKQKPGERQVYGIGFIVTLMFAIAVALLLQRKIKYAENEQIPTSEYYYIVTSALIYAVYCAICFALAFTSAGVQSKRKWFAAYVLFTVVGAVAQFVVGALTLGRWYSDGDTWIMHAFFISGVATAATIAWTLLYMCGFQIDLDEAKKQDDVQTQQTSELLPESESHVAASTSARSNVHGSSLDDWDID